jgi:small GTP-binding protein
MPGSAIWEKSTLVGLIGNPNAGKTSIFNALTGGNAKVGNYPGVTVEKMSGRFKIDDLNIEIVDIPGLYSMTPMSRDEEIATAAIRATLSEGPTSCSSRRCRLGAICSSSAR